jgi:hypothetical protein
MPAIRTGSANGLACSFRIAQPRWTFTVISIAASSAAICWLGRTVATGP